MNDVAFHADNATFYSASADKSVKAWRFASDAPVRNIAGHAGNVDGVAFSPNGQELASCSHDGTIRIWTVATGAAVRTINAFTQPAATAVYTVSWSPDGKQLLGGSLNQMLRLFDAASGNLVREFKAYNEKDFPKGHKGKVYTAAFSKDGQFLLSGGDDMQIKVWSVADGQVVRQLIDPSIPPTPGAASERAHADWIEHIRFSPDGARVASVGYAGWLKVWNFADGKLIYQQKLLPKAIYAVSFSSDGKSLATGNDNGTAFVLKAPN